MLFTIALFIGCYLLLQILKQFNKSTLFLQQNRTTKKESFITKSCDNLFFFNLIILFKSFFMIKKLSFDHKIKKNL